MQLPTHYLIDSNISPEEVAAIQQALTVTPLDCVVIHWREDTELAAQFSTVIMHPESIPGLLEGGARFAIVGQFDAPLQAVYSNHKERISC